MDINGLSDYLTHILAPEAILSDPAECWVYGYDNSKRLSAPDRVVFPRTHDDVLNIVKGCHQYRVPLVARGRGTGTPGGSVPIQKGIVMSFERMADIIKIDTANRYATVQPGVINQDLQHHLKPHGFFWPVNPSSAAFCTIGGNLAYNASGPLALKYGTTRDNTLGLTAVTGDGRTLRAGVVTSKGVVGYDLTRLIIGSEGTLAIITQATLKLIPRPTHKQTIAAYYASFAGAAQAIVEVMQQPVTPCAFEFMDSESLQLVRNHSPLPIPDNAHALLIIEVDGQPHAIDEDTHLLMTIAKNSDCVAIAKAADDNESKQLWAARKALSPTLRDLAPKKINEDIVVPIANIPALLEKLKNLSAQFNIPIVNFGHAGNGNIHVNLLCEPTHSDDLARAKDCLAQVFDCVLALDGTLSGEHGIGLEKQPYIHKELDATHLDVMKKIKSVFDPHDILNPGKIWQTI